MVHEVGCQLPSLALLELWQSEAPETVTVNVPPISCFSNEQGTPAALQKAHQVPLQSPNQ